MRNMSSFLDILSFRIFGTPMALCSMCIRYDKEISKLFGVEFDYFLDIYYFVKIS
jgi:hypothetical protein